MRKMLAAGAALLLAAGCAGQSAPPYPPTITVNGIGTSYAEPETALISFGFSVSETDPETAVESAAEQAESAMASAEAAGIDRESITTTGYSLWIEEEYDYNTYTYTGNTLYHVDHSMQVKVGDTEQVGTVLAALVAGGANTVYSVQFTVEDRADLYARAREQALDDAARSAGQLAERLGVSISGVQSVSEWVDYYAQPYYDSMGMIGAGESSPPLNPANQSITLNVSVSYLISQ